ncbi:Mce protein [Mycobacterium sp. CBMA293]|uniref:Mce protein n=1 Tax=unclassified Mycolicibacterium TaxID=2636767 RepID=UPI0012DCC502|nr:MULTISPECIES: Mce protein [unclassified Mycolicibacterium]MUL45848.1 Mce protein [Mycolicibacterium sp. CBMA 360]MUL60520.1 Mce protein [Mycolicibacterium sp. CBMA 335]MUL72335.1 Mce protein [Mycolicibacterium sp. CBMA 311]MUL95264.1 Mce protein [Mycolicibacterium sp. CBMA 230]MUM06917.1 hypothetical protein [Mycolicibacterium sp. CBMA 213]
MADEHGRHRSPDEVDTVDASADDAPTDVETDDAGASDDAALDFLKHTAPKRDNRALMALVAGIVVVAALGALVTWQAQRELQLRRTDALRQMYLTAARQCAENLTSIDYRHADADIQRVLDTATGAYFDDFKKSAATVVDSVKQQQAVSVGSVVEAGVESMTDATAAVLVAVKVHTDVSNGPPQKDRFGRIRLTMLKDGDSAKVSKVDPVQ